jgi:hypothetical protein
MDYSLDDIESPICPGCGVEMQLYRSELVKFVPVVDLHSFTCETCLLFAQSEIVREHVWVPPDSRVPCVRFFSPWLEQTGQRAACAGRAFREA